MGRPEDSRVKIPAILHLARLGYEYFSLKGLESGTDYDGDTNIFYRPFCNALDTYTHLGFEDAKRELERVG